MATYAELFNRADGHPLLLDFALLDMLGPQWLGWDPDSVFVALERRFSGTALSRSSKNKIYALGLLHSNQAFWQDWRAFEACCWALSGRPVDLAEVTPATAMVMSYAVRTAGMLDNTSTYSEEVAAYAGAVLLEEQFSLAPEFLGFAQPYMIKERPHIEDRRRDVLVALQSGVNPSLEQTSGDPVEVEVTRHRVLSAVMNVVCSPAMIAAQADRYGLGSMVRNMNAGVD